MEERYSRNRIYIKENEQERIKHFHVLLGGAGIGSNIAECALRIGFETMTIVDGDKVEESNLNRQGYTMEDIGQYKAECLKKRLLAINPKAHITAINTFINHNNVQEIIGNCDVAVNALDFKNDIPFAFDEVCREKNIKVLHPYNFGWAGFLTVATPDGMPISSLSRGNANDFELKMANYVVGYKAFWMEPMDWLEKVVRQFEQADGTLPPPQLAVASWIVGGLCATALFQIATGKPLENFPKFYLDTIIK